jgi:peptide-methionine (S)-S-oxide reductase
MNDQSSTREIATLGGGCFWCVEAVLSCLRGVHRVVPGYSGGTTDRPTYQQVCTGSTGHAEVVQVTFDPSEISYRELLDVFFASHDPTTLNRQGADVGTQYRSVIFYHSPEQRQVAEELIRDLNAQAIWPRPIVTQIVPVGPFYEAEDYHHDYYHRNPTQPYCQVVIEPKLTKLRQKYGSRLKS